MEMPRIDIVVTTTLTSSAPFVLGSFRSILASPEELQPLWPLGVLLQAKLLSADLGPHGYPALSSQLPLGAYPNLPWVEFIFQLFLLSVSGSDFVKPHCPTAKGLASVQLNHWPKIGTLGFQTLPNHNSFCHHTKKTPNLLDLNLPCSTVPKVSTLHSLQSFIHTISLHSSLEESSETIV